MFNLKNLNKKKTYMINPRILLNTNTKSNKNNIITKTKKIKLVNQQINS